MRSIVFYTFLAVFFTSNFLYSQGFLVQQGGVSSWKRMAKLPDGGTVLLGSPSSSETGFLQKVDSSGMPQWLSAALPATTAVDVTVLPDGPIVVLVRKNSNSLFSLVSYQADGQTSWTQALPSSIGNLQRIVAAPQNGGLAAGSAPIQDHHLAIQLVRFDGNGIPIWTKTLQEVGSDLIFSSMVALPDGKWMLGGTIRTDTETDYFIAKLEETGQLEWIKTLPSVARQTAYDLQLTTDGGIALLGYTQQVEPTTIDLLKLDLAGNLLWKKSIFTEGGFTFPGAPLLAPFLTSFCQLPTGDFFLPYIKGTINQGKLVLIRLDQAGQMRGQLEVTAAEQVHQILPVSDHQLAVCGSIGLPREGLFLQCDPEGQLLPHRVSGTLFADTQANCTPDNGEPALVKWIIEARPLTGKSLFTTTDQEGSFSISLPSGVYQIIPQAPTQVLHFWTTCDTPQVNLLTGSSPQINVAPIGLQAAFDCPILEVDLQSGPLLPCQTATWHLRFGNVGNQEASNTKIRIEKSAQLEFESASFPLISFLEDTLLFEVGNIPAGEGGIMELRFFLPCNLPLQQAIRVQASLQSDNNCLPPDPSWDGAEIILEESCSSLEGIQFTLSNKGTGNMGSELEYIIIEDQIILSTGKFKLNAGSDSIFTIENPQGAHYWMRAGQSIGQPALEAPSVFSKNCLAPENTDRFQLELPDQESLLAVSVHTGLTSNGQAGPVEMIGYPLGWQDLHNISPDQELEYVLFYTNNSLDTVRTIQLVDSLPAAQLDLSTLRPGAGSKKYQWELVGENILRFNLRGDVLYPDQSGFVSFRIRPKAGLPMGTLIQNKAQVRLDYAPPSVTNTTFHTISPFIPTTSLEEIEHLDHIRLYPNPSDQGFWLLSEIGLPTKGCWLRMLDVKGQTVRNIPILGLPTFITTQQLPSGVYIIQLYSESQGVSTRRWIKQ
jgi:hypothetical protein